MSNREHLPRDDAGAAVERAARLEEENARLRGEIENLRRPPVKSGAPAPRSSVPLAVTLLVALVAVVVVAFGLAAFVVTRRSGPPIVERVSPPIPIMTEAPPAPQRPPPPPMLEASGPRP